MDTKDRHNHLSEIVTSCSNCKLSSLCLPQGLVTTELEGLKSIVKQLPSVSYKKNIFRQGDAFKYLYILRAGGVKVYSTNIDGEEQVMSFTLPGELLGIDAIASGQYRTTAVALDTVSLCRVEYEKFEYLCLDMPKLSKHILKVISQGFGSELDIRTALAQKSAKELVAFFIMSLSTRFSLLRYSRTVFILPMSRSDIANYLGIAKETVSRKFAQLRDDGIIDVDQKKIRINDMNYLKKLAGHCEECPTTYMAAIGA